MFDFIKTLYNTVVFTSRADVPPAVGSVIRRDDKGWWVRKIGWRGPDQYGNGEAWLLYCLPADEE